MIPDTSVESFRRHLDAVRGHNTAVKYAQSANRFLVFLGSAKIDIDRMPPGILQMFAEWLLHSQQLSRRSTSVMSYGAKAYLEWLADRGKDIPNPGKIQLRRQSGTPVPYVIEQSVLVNYLRVTARIIKEPYRTAMLLLPYCGLRLNELTKLEIANIGQRRINDEAFLTIELRGDQTKNGRGRVVPILLDGKPILLAYLKTWRRNVVGSYLFPGRPPTSPIVNRTISYYVNQVRLKINAPRLHPHMLRRVYLTTLARHGVTGPDLARIAGHASLQTTADYYLALDVERLAGRVQNIRLVGSQDQAISTAGGLAKAQLGQLDPNLLEILRNDERDLNDFGGAEDDDENDEET